MHGKPLYPADFDHFNYVNPQAPKGGTIRYGATGSFDSLNPFIVSGTSVIGLREHVFESLMARGYDEAFTLYGLLADSVELSPDRDWVTFHINPKARFSDGVPVTVDDVIYSLETLRDKGRPLYKTYYSKVVAMERPSPGSVKLIFGPDGDREIPLIIGLMPILPKHIYEKRNFDKSSYETAVGSGPYVVDKVDSGSRITYRRNKDYWGADLPVNRGQNNFDLVIYDYYRDSNASFEAFKAGLYDARPEDDPGRWTTGYDIPAVRDGRIRQSEFKSGMPSGMHALVFNTRHGPLADQSIRKALTLLFDFEWVNKTLYHGVYVRTQSFFDNSALSSHGVTADAEERRLLKPFPDAVSPDIMAHGYEAPVGDPKGQNRANRSRAIALLKIAGYELRDGKMVSAKSNVPLTFEILVATPDDERLALVYASMVRRIGVDIKVRNVDPSQYQKRRDNYQYDMIFNDWFASLSPGNEQSFYWGSEAADVPGTRNYMGAKSPAIDAMIEALLAARDRAAFESAVRALDRVLMSQDYVIPLFHQPTQWVALWNRVKTPDTTSLYGYRSTAWWIDPGK
ncbi:MAG: ABC transporter substrate-binding protein [Rhizobiales bacterium]|nr:ABC transporter substrate-binding protein [Hyphomicrobiales bacterium]